jgi:multiple sugar transport system permease protein
MSGIHRSVEARAALWFVAPALLLIAAFFVLPVFMGAALSLTDFDLYTIADWRALRTIGVRNFTETLSSPLFRTAIRNTVWFAVLALPLTLTVSLSLALMLNESSLRGAAFFRTVFFAPFVTTIVAVAVVFRAVYHAEYGLANWALGVIGVAPRDWLGDPVWAMPALVLLRVWKSFGYYTLILLAGLQTIPRELYDAARLDGASPWQRLRAVTIPGLRPSLLFVGTIALIDALQLFAEPYIMTRGGPARATTSVVLVMYEEGFRWWRMGSGAAIAVLLFLILLTVTFGQRWLERRWRLA